MQAQLGRKSSFEEGIRSLLQLRRILMKEMLAFQKKISPQEFSSQPFPKAKGYHCKTVAYSLWHIFRIEDIVVNSLIQRQTQILISGDYQNRMHAPIITTGNELNGTQIADFSSQLDIDVLYDYIQEVDQTTNQWLQTLSVEELKRKMTQEERLYLKTLQVVSEDENASWLIDYWCGKDIAGLLKMPLSRHWIMHIEASLRIIDKIQKLNE